MHAEREREREQIESEQMNAYKGVLPTAVICFLLSLNALSALRLKQSTENPIQGSTVGVGGYSPVFELVTAVV